MNTGKINEIFKSYQGEGLWQGKEQVFIRFFGCNLNCKFCDTKQSFYQLMPIAQVLERVNSFGRFHSVSLTGGEPLLQIHFLEALLPRLKKQGWALYLETNGVLYKNLAKIINYIDLISMDFKLPSSTGQFSYWRRHRNFIKVAQNTHLFAKVVIGRETLWEDLDKTIEIIKKIKPDLFLVLQPENPYESLLKEKLTVFKKRCTDGLISVKIIPQLHKKMGIK